MSAADSWEAFAQALREESASIARLHERARALTDALLADDPDRIEVAQRELEAGRVAHQRLLGRRRNMQRRGFGKLPLRDVCGYAPPALQRDFGAVFAELSYHALSLGLTNNNNKAIIRGGMERLLKVVSIVQRASAEQSGTYRRRGLVAAPDASVIVSKRA